MGAVYLAEQVAVGNRPVALKLLSRKLLDDPDFLLRFQNEAASTGRIHHPNVVTIYESGQADDGTPYIAMEFLEGESLRQALARRGALPVAEVAEILQQAARGLNAAHKLGIIHRDLKPDNIFLTYPDDAAPPAQDVGVGLVPTLPVGDADPGRAQDPPLRPVVVKLVDFGIAKLRESGAHTQTGMVLGTPAYMSFEQASGMRSDELDARSDIYSLGVVIYEMLTARTPFKSDTPVGYLRMHMQEDPPPFRAVKPDLPALPQVEILVMKALTKDRDQRYGSVLEFAREFAKAAAAGSAPAARPESQATPAPALKTIAPTAVRYSVAGKPVPGRPPTTRRKWLVVGSIVLMLAVATAGFWYWGSRGLRSVLRQSESSPGGTSTPFTLERTLSGHTDGVDTIAFSPDGKLLASGSTDSQIQAAESTDKEIKLWDVASGSLRQTLAGHKRVVFGVVFSPDGKLLASCSGDKTIKLWDVASGTLKQTLSGHHSWVLSVGFSPDGEVLASGSADCSVKLWDVASGALRKTLTFANGVGFAGWVESVAFNPDGRLLALGMGDNTVKLLDMPIGTLGRTLTGHTNVVTCVAFSPDGKLLVSGSDDNTVKLWDVASGAVRRTLIGHSHGVQRVAFSPDGILLASGSTDETIKLWDVASGNLRQTLAGHGGIVFSVAFSPDGKLLASGSEDKTIKLWRHTTGSALSQLVGWGLPIKLGQTSADVSQALGKPTEIVNAAIMHRKTGDDYSDVFPAGRELRYYYSAGIVGAFEADKLVEIILNPRSDYKGFIPYSGAIVDNFKLTDAKDEILRKLGKESELKEDPLEAGTDRDKPVVWPAETHYHWRRAGYIVEVDFLRQAQSVDEKKHLTMPKDSVAVVSVYK
jgi:WD40 repeat protein